MHENGFMSLSVSSQEDSQYNLLNPLEALSENIWFVWFETSYGGDKWKCHAWSHTDIHTCEYIARIL